MSKPMDSAWREFQAFASEHGGEEFTQKLTKALGFVGLSRLLYRANRGCFQSAKWLAENWLGDPALPFEERAKQMTPEEVRDAFAERWSRAWGWDRETCDKHFDLMDAAMRRQGEHDGDED